MDGHGHVGEDRHRPDRRDGDLPAALDGVADVEQGVVDVTVLDLEVRDGGPQRHVPVDEVAVAVDDAALVQAHEGLDHRLGVVVVHREALAPVVERGAEPLELLDDLRAPTRPPGPDALGEPLPPRS
jgi:hypothetical protein